MTPDRTLADVAATLRCRPDELPAAAAALLATNERLTATAADLQRRVDARDWTNEPHTPTTQRMIDAIRDKLLETTNV